MELKYLQGMLDNSEKDCSNRTFMELKYIKQEEKAAHQKF